MLHAGEACSYNRVFQFFFFFPRLHPELKTPLAEELEKKKNEEFKQAGS